MQKWDYNQRDAFKGCFRQLEQSKGTDLLFPEKDRDKRTFLLYVYNADHLAEEILSTKNIQLCQRETSQNLYQNLSSANRWDYKIYIHHPRTQTRGNTSLLKIFTGHSHFMDGQWHKYWWAGHLNAAKENRDTLEHEHMTSQGCSSYCVIKIG